MLAHLHASLNFAIYSLSNRAFLVRYLRRNTHLLPCCSHLSRTTGAAGVSSFFRFSDEAPRASGSVIERANVNRTLITVECHQYLQTEGCSGTVAEASSARRLPVSVTTEEAL